MVLPALPAERLSFVELMTLESVEEIDVNGESVPQFMGKYTAPNFGGSAGYGGYVYAQSVWAAAQSVAEGMVVHNVHGYFTLPVYSDRPLFYSVQTLSSGRSYCTRFITVRQPVETCSFPFESASCKRNLGKICFASMCSFKKDEEAPTKHQIKAGLKETYGNIIKDDPAEHRNAPKIDTPWWCTNMESNSHLTPDDFHGLDVKKVEMSSYNNSKPPEEWRQLQYYKPVGRIPSDLPNLHACAHLFASDRNSLFIISNAGGFGDQIGAMGSLSHAVVFHVNSQDLMFEEDKWLCQEAWTPRSEGGRGMHESRIWNSDEVLIASTWQDGLVRKAGGESKVAVWMGGKGEKSKRVDGSHEVLKANQSKL